MLLVVASFWLVTGCTILFFVLLPVVLGVYWIKNGKCKKFCIRSASFSAPNGVFLCAVFVNYTIKSSKLYFANSICLCCCGKVPSLWCLCVIFIIYNNNNDETVKCVWKKHQKLFHWIKRRLQPTVSTPYYTAVVHSQRHSHTFALFDAKFPFVCFSWTTQCVWNIVRFFLRLFRAPADKIFHIL